MEPIAIDAMGGDQMPGAAVEGAIQAVGAGMPVVLVGDQAVLAPALAARAASIPVVHAADVIGMDEPASDVRRRRQSSVMVGMQLVKDGKASACISMGHSGATMAAALLVLGRLPSIERPAILANIPATGGFVALIDAGANADCRPVHLQQFAVMGSVYARAFYGKDAPSVGLMSIGEEASKGNELTREAHVLLTRTEGIRFVGNVEGRDLVRGATDVVVTDGFTGNVILKLAEGEARELFGWIRDALRSTPMARLGGLLVRGVLTRLARRLDPSEYGAQPLLGVDGYAFIGHGSSDARAVRNAVATARRAVDADLVGRIRAGMEMLQPPSVKS